MLLVPALSFLVFPIAGQEADGQVIAIHSPMARPAGVPFFISLDRVETKGHWALENINSGVVLPLQAYGPGRLAALLEAPLAAGERREYELRPRRPEERPPQIEWKKEEGLLSLSVDGKQVLGYALEEQLPGDSLPGYYRRSGFLHPVRSPSGAIVTDGFPTGHTHQHGIFMAWVNTLFRGEQVDFWNQHKETGTVEHRKLDTLLSGPVFAEARVHLRHRALAFGPVLEEEWRIRVFNRNAPLIWEIDSRQLNITEDTLQVLEYHYGGLGIRGSRHWNAADSIHFLEAAKVITGLGNTRQTANHTHPGWVAIYGPVTSGTAGIAAMDHPDNFRHPQAVRVHPEMPYFCFAPMMDGAFDLAPGEPYSSRYRFVIFDGPPDVGLLEMIYEDFGAPIMSDP